MYNLGKDLDLKQDLDPKFLIVVERIRIRNVKIRIRNTDFGSVVDQGLSETDQALTRYDSELRYPNSLVSSLFFVYVM